MRVPLRQDRQRGRSKTRQRPLASLNPADAAIDESATLPLAFLPLPSSRVAGRTAGVMRPRANGGPNARLSANTFGGIRRIQRGTFRSLI